MQGQKPTDESLLAEIDTSPRSGLTRLYEVFREPFLAFCRKHGYPEEVSLEAYHDAVLAFYHLYRDGQYTGEKAGIKTLLYAIGKNQIFQKLRKETRYSSLVANIDIDVNLFSSDSHEAVLDERDQQLAHAFGGLSEGCREVLTLFYYYRFSINAITHEMGYANENVTKSHKSRCLRKLKELYKTINV
jgi:RNA polymerase sigma-70 factor (ECF subfamily)